MRLIVLMLITFTAQAENYNYLEISQGINVSSQLWGKSDWNGSCPTGVAIGRHWDYDKNVYFRAQFNHLSNICKGPPFSKSGWESSLDQINATIGIKF